MNIAVEKTYKYRCIMVLCRFLILREDGPHLAASKIDNNFNLSTGRLENAQAIHLFAISSFIGWSASNEDVDDAFFLLGYCLQLFITVVLLIISMY